MFNLRKFVVDHPRLFHLSGGNAWSNIAVHGLLCAADVLARCDQTSDVQKLAIYEARRRGDLPFDVPRIGRVIVRDQRPLFLSGLAQALDGRMVPMNWVDLLNDRVFFWIRPADAHSLANANSYCRTDRTLIEFDTASIIDAYRTKIAFTDFNVGYTMRKPKKRGIESFVRMDDFSGRWGKIRELTITGSVPDVAEHVRRVTLMKAIGECVDIPLKPGTFE